MLTNGIKIPVYLVGKQLGIIFDNMNLWFEDAPPEGVYTNLAEHNRVISTLLNEKYKSENAEYGMFLQFLYMVNGKASNSKWTVDLKSLSCKYLKIECDKIITIGNITESVDIYIKGYLGDNDSVFETEIFVVNGALGGKNNESEIVSYYNELMKQSDDVNRYLVYLNPFQNRCYHRHKSSIPKEFIVVPFDDLRERLIRYIDKSSNTMVQCVPDDSPNLKLYKDYEEGSCCYSVIINWHLKTITTQVSSDATITSINNLFEDGDINVAKSKIDSLILLGGGFVLKPKDKEQLRMVLEREELVDYLNSVKTNGKINIPLKIDASEIKDMSGLFMGIPYGGTVDLSKWKVKNVENMCMMFYNTNIRLKGLEKWDVSKVRNMKWMMEGTDENHKIVDGWKEEGRLNDCIEIEEIFF